MLLHIFIIVCICFDFRPIDCSNPVSRLNSCFFHRKTLNQRRYFQRFILHCISVKAKKVSFLILWFVGNIHFLSVPLYFHLNFFLRHSHRTQINIQIIADINMITIKLCNQISLTKSAFISRRSLFHRLNPCRRIADQSNDNQRKQKSKNKVKYRTSCNDAKPPPHACRMEASRTVILFILSCHHTRTTERQQLH